MNISSKLNKKSVKVFYKECFKCIDFFIPKILFLQYQIPQRNTRENNEQTLHAWPLKFPEFGILQCHPAEQNFVSYTSEHLNKCFETGAKTFNSFMVEFKDLEQFTEKLQKTTDS